MATQLRIEPWTDVAAGVVPAVTPRPFAQYQVVLTNDGSVPTAPDGVIVTTTTATGQADVAVPRRHALVMFAPDGTELLAIRVEAFVEHGLAVDRTQWRALDRWLATRRLRRVAPRPLAELACRTHPTPGDVACPTTTGGLVRTPTGIAQWNPDGGSPIWGWGEPQVAELGDTCVVLAPDNRGSLDRTEAHAVPCPPPE